MRKGIDMKMELVNNINGDYVTVEKYGESIILRATTDQSLYDVTVLIDRETKNKLIEFLRENK